MISKAKSSTVVDRLLHTEQALNEIRFDSVPLGGLFSKLLFTLYRNDGKADNKSKFSFAAIACYLSIKNFFTAPKVNADRGKKILLIRITNRPNRKKLIDPLAEIFEEDSILFSSTASGKGNNYILDTLPQLGFFSTIGTLVSAIILFPRILKVFRQNDIQCSPALMFNVLLTQLLRLKTCIKIFRRLSLSLVISDFDRHDMSNCFILAAQRFKIKTVTLVHGAIYPPYGYVPVLADEIWCWGALQKAQLQEMSVASSKIRVVGNPIAEVACNLDFDLDSIKKEYELSGKIVIGLALNDIGLENNNTIINFIFQAFEAAGEGKFILLIKPYPAMKEHDLAAELNSHPQLRLHKRKYSNDIFFCLCDFLLTRGSSMGYEAIVNDLPTGVIDIDSMTINKGNMDVMVNLCGCPLFKEKEQLVSFFKGMLNNIDNSKKELLSKQRLFVMNDYYYKIGRDAISEIATQIKTVAYS